MNERLTLVIVYSIVLLILVILSFIFSSADMAYGSVDKYKIQNELEKKPNSKRIKRAKNLSSNYEKTITTILFCNDTVNAGLDTIATLLGVNLAYLIFSDPLIAGEKSELIGLIASLSILVFKITFGEIVPKSLAKIKNYSFSVTFANLVNVMRYITSPITYPISKLGGAIAKLFKKNVEEISITEDDLHEMIDSIEEQGTVDEEKAELLHETINYTQTVAEEVMTPRVNVFAIDIEDDIKELLKDQKMFEHSRVLVYRHTIDNVVGYIHIRALMKKVLANEEFEIEDLIIEPLRFPQTAEINDIMRVFKKTKQHFALVMDEYGGLDGILTMEDILEEIVGEIWDEYDKGQEPVVERKDGSFILDGSVTIEDFCDLFDLNFEDVHSEYLTLGGLVIELLDDKFAKVGDEMDFMGIHLKVIALEDNGAVNKLIAYEIEDEDSDE